MFIKRLTENMIQVGEVIYEYDLDQLKWVSINGNSTERHMESLNHFIITETPESEKFYKDYFNFIDHIEEVLNSVGLCLAQ